MDANTIEERLTDLRRKLTELERAGLPERLSSSFRALVDDFDEMIVQENQLAERLIDTAQTIVLVLDAEGRVVTLNPYMEEISGYKLEEVRGADWFTTFLPERDHQRVSDYFHQAVSEIEVRGHINPIVTKDGRERKIEWYGKTLKDAQGNVKGVLSVGQDITDRLAQQDELRRREAQLRAILEIAVDGIVSIDATGVIKSFNAAAEHMFGYSAAEVVGNNVSVLMPAALQRAHNGHFTRYLDSADEKPTGSGHEVIGMRKDGTTFHLQYKRGEMHVDGERQFTAILHDITERKQLEQRYREAQKLEAVATLTGGIAHDYNNLLMGIMGCMDLALKRIALDSPARIYLDEVRLAAKRGASLTRQLLTFSRRRETSPTNVDLDAVIESAEKMVRSMLGEQITLRLKLGAGSWRVHCDVGQVEQVLMNLVVNARDAMPKRGVLDLETAEITLHSALATSMGLEAGEFVVLRVSDSGIGMDAATKERIFEPFFTTKETGHGTGLGLSSVYGIVKHAGGHIDVQSWPKEGTTFALYFPKSEFATSPRISAPQTATRRRGAETVLIVEDDPLVRMTVRGYVEPWGYRVLDACDLAEASLIVQHNAKMLDLVITDVMLPGGTGGQVAAAIGDLRPDLPVIFMSAHPAEALAKMEHLPPGATTLLKPFSEDDLFDEICRALDGGKGVVSRSKTTLLLVEDQLNTRNAIAELPAPDYEVLCAKDRADALAICQQHQGAIDAALVDIGVPDMSGSKLAAELRALRPSIAIVYVSGGSIHELQHLLEAPKTTYVQKPVEIDDLARAVDALLASP